MKILRPEQVTSFPDKREMGADELKEAYALARAAFTADDLQRYTEVLKGVPAEEVLRDLEDIQQRLEQDSR